MQSCSGKLAGSKKRNLAKVVNATLGTKGKGFGVGQRYLEAGYTFPGAVSPFGMVQFTTTFFDENKGFVINQMSGAGCHNMGNLPMLPLTGEMTTSPKDMMSFKPEIQIKDVHAGYYQAQLFDQVNCELTASTRTGFARMSFNDSEKGTIIIGTGINSTEVTESHVKITGMNSFEGMADGGNFCGANSKYKIYFAGEFNRAASSYGTWRGDSLQKNSSATEGNNSGVYFTFDAQDDSLVLYKVGISYVSLANARLNLKTENPDWNFENIKKQAESEWNNVLKLVDVEGGSQDKIIQFYSHLYHCFIHPSVFNDVNGQYIGADFKIHTSDVDYYTAFSNWDTYRTQIQLLSMLVPERASEMVSSLLTFAEQSGGGFPRWVCANFETGIMQGDPSAALVANAYAFGAKDFDATKALEVMRRGAEVQGTLSQGIETREHLDQYLNDGFISASMGASMLLEYTSADFAIAQFAHSISPQNEGLYETYLKRSEKWKNIYNPESTWLQSRFADGSWKPQTDDWREASFKNYFWMVPYDLPTLIDTIGGAKVAEKRLDEFFTKLNADYSEQFFAAGNEPSFQSPWSYNWVGKPAKTQKIVRRIINEQYSNRDCGLPGNDDMGAMAAWYVFADLGLYPMVPGIGGFSISSPMFEQVTITLGNGKKLEIIGGSEKEKYITHLNVNGTEWKSTWLPLSEVENGGTLRFSLTGEPSDWGARQSPPDFTKQE